MACAQAVAFACATLAGVAGAASPPAAPVQGPMPPPGTPAAQGVGVLQWRGPLAPLVPSPQLQPLPTGETARALPVVLQADRLQGQPDLSTRAQGNVELRRGGLVVRADELEYDAPTDVVDARGRVRVSRAGGIYSGPRLRMSIDRQEGFFQSPEFDFPQLGAGGRAERVDFQGPSRSRALQASYTSCPREGGIEPAWELRTDAVTFDLEQNEGLAQGARLRFLGTTLLAIPALSFPLTEDRKSGWLPPTVSVDNRSGVELAVPYYFNIAPQRDATLVPRLISRRGVGLDGEFRYLEPTWRGTVAVNWLPHDQVAGRSRQSLSWQHEGAAPWGLEYRAEVLRVSDDDWWKDFTAAPGALSPRLLPARFSLERPFRFGQGAVQGEGLWIARSQRWQVLQSSDSPVQAPFQRSPQLGVALSARGAGLELSLESEFNRFTQAPNQPAGTATAGGDRWHLLAALSHPVRQPGWWVVPRLSVNAARYSPLPGSKGEAGSSVSRVRDSRVIPSFSVDAGLELERTTQAFGRTLHQTLEPRVLYVNTPFRAQAHLPSYDAAAKDFNFVSLYSDNAFSGVDRVSDAHQLTAGFTTRLVDAASGAEALRLGLVQRVLFRTQQVAPQADGSPDGPALTQRFSDALLLGSTSVLPGWGLSAAVQYSPEIQRSIRSVITASYTPGPFRTVSATYRFARGLAEQGDLGWQWPLSAGTASPGPSASAGGRCNGRWFSVGRISYSLKDRRVTDSVLGLEYDAGCWIARLVATQLSTGRNEATTRLGFQLELTGFSKLNVGANPLKVLKDNVPGYRLLREERGSGLLPSSDRPSVSPFYE